MNSKLLDHVSFDLTVKQTPRGATHPLMMEFPVNQELAPFLVTSTRSVQWVNTTSQTGTLRAAVRDRQGIEAEIVFSVMRQGVEFEWGNVHDLSTEGIKKCLEHVSFYGLAPLEILVSPHTVLTDFSFPAGVAINVASWMPLDMALVIPVDRSFVGTLGTIGKHKAVAVVHNAARGMAIASRLLDPNNLIQAMEGI